MCRRLEYLGGSGGMHPWEIVKFCTSGMQFSAFWGANQSGLIALNSSQFFASKRTTGLITSILNGDPENRSICVASNSANWWTINEASHLTDEQKKIWSSALSLDTTHQRSPIYVPVKLKLQHPPLRATPLAFELLKIGLFKFPPLRAKMPFKCPTN